MKENKRPAEDDDRVETLAEIARILNERFPPIEGIQPVSRQLLHKAHKGASRKNRFPSPVVEVGSSYGGRGHTRFKVSEVVAWYVTDRWYRIQGTSRNSNDEDTSLAA